jgi:pyruvate/2-oxoglutarate dehydrogenase complex dihydrolipoamide dehydrogenase (E3) component
MERIDTDILVIGGGSGGLSVAAGAVQMGARVVLLEGHKMGGDCLNYGCVPSKALLAAASVAHAQGGNAAMGVGPGQATINYGRRKSLWTQSLAKSRRMTAWPGLRVWA